MYNKLKKFKIYSTSDVNYLTDDQSISTAESFTSIITPDLPCSISGSTSISFSIGNYLKPAPSWVSIGSTSGALTIIAPEVALDTEFDFYINSDVSGVSSPIHKLIKLTILNCISSNCQRCVNSSGSICAVCISGYDLNSGTCVQNLDVAKALSSATKAMGGAIIGVSIFTSLLNAASLASLWMTINQLQLFWY